jgi:hypothetical protein
MNEEKRVQQAPERGNGPSVRQYRYSDEGGSHLHTLDDKPLIGTTTAMNVLAKPLVWWAAGEACREFGWMHEKAGTHTERLARAMECLDEVRKMEGMAYLAKLDKAYRAHDTIKRETALDGTDIHAKCERYVLHCMNTNAGRPIPPPEGKTGPTVVFAKWACRNVERFRWAEAHCYSEKLWVGGISDCGAILNSSFADEKDIAIIDFKRAKAAYFSHFVQLAGYALQIEENGLFTEEGVNIVEPLKIDSMVVFPFGGGKPVLRVYNPEYEEVFKGILKTYKLQKEFDEQQ